MFCLPVMTSVKKSSELVYPKLVIAAGSMYPCSIPLIMPGASSAIPAPRPNCESAWAIPDSWGLSAMKNKVEAVGRTTMFPLGVWYSWYEAGRLPIPGMLGIQLADCWTVPRSVRLL